MNTTSTPSQFALDHEAVKLHSRWASACARFDRCTEETRSERGDAEQRARDLLTTFLDANGLTGAEFDPRPLTGAPTTTESDTSMSNTLPPVIGLGGLLGSGKDAVADYLVSDHGFAKHFMSEPMGRSLYALNPWISIEYETNGGADAVRFVRYRDFVDEVGYTAAKQNPEVRALLQRLGWDVGRLIIGENTWVDIAERSMTSDRRAGLPTALTGVRTMNEIDLIEKLGGTLIWVNRPNNPYTTDASAGHLTETSVGPSDFHIIIENDGTLDELRAKVEALAASLTAGIAA